MSARTGIGELIEISFRGGRKGERKSEETAPSAG